MDQKVPQHIAIVMDGNGRWAQKRGLPRFEGHKAGLEPIRQIIRSCIEKNIPCLSLFAFSSENWARPSDEVNFLMDLFLQSLQNELPELNSNGIRLHFTGCRNALSKELQQRMQHAELVTQDNKQLILNIVINYGGKWDIVQAVKNVAQAVLEGNLPIDDLDETVFSQFLATKGLPDPDLFIRTSGELRISNFYLWQLAYAELYFTKVHWPDFNEQEFALALDEFSKRKRRFGQISTSP